MPVNFTPFPIIFTERLIIRNLTHDDAEELFSMRCQKSIMQFIPRPLATSIEDVLQLITKINSAVHNNESINWAITLKEENKLIGTIGFVRMKIEDHRAEVGYLLQTDMQGKGIMSEALTAVIDYGFNTMCLHTIEAVIDPRNTASEKLLQKHKFLKEGHLKENIFFNGEFLDSVYYTLFNPIKKI